MTLKKQQDDIYLKAKELEIYSMRIDQKIIYIKTLTHLNLELNNLLKKHNTLVKTIKVFIKENSYKIDYQIVLKDLDLKCFVKVKTKLNDLKKFFELKNRCLNVLPKVYNNSIIISDIRNVKSSEALNKILNKVPYEIVISNGLIELDSNDTWLTKKSVKAISTYMKNQ